MNYQEMLKEARQNLNGSCKVCKACNGVACSGEVPGMGGKGTGSAFTENFKSLQNVKINMIYLLLASSAAATNPLNSGCGRFGLDFNSG